MDALPNKRPKPLKPGESKEPKLEPVVEKESGNYSAKYRIVESATHSYYHVQKKVLWWWMTYKQNSDIISSILDSSILAKDIYYNVFFSLYWR